PENNFCTMSAQEVTMPAFSMEDRTIASGLRDEHHGEGNNGDEEAYNNKHIKDSQSGSGMMMPGSDEHAGSSQQLSGPSTKQHTKVEAGPQPHLSHHGSKEEDSMSEGIDILEEDTCKDLVEKRSKAPKRVEQLYDYIKLMEDRMAAMESQLQKVKVESVAAAPKQETSSELSSQPTSVNGEAEEAPPPPPPPPKQLQLNIAHLRWDEFDKIGTSGKHVIDVLIDYMKPRRQKKAAKQEEKKENTEDRDKKSRDEEKKEEYESNHPRSASAGEKRSLLPERMCIYSDLLIDILNDITSLSLSSPLIIIRPFKVLINWESEIRQRLALLEENWRVLDASADKEQERSATVREPNPAREVAMATEREGNADGAWRIDRLNASETPVAHKPMELIPQQYEQEDKAEHLSADEDKGNKKYPTANLPKDQSTGNDKQQTKPIDMTGGQPAEKLEEKASEKFTGAQGSLTDNIQDDLRPLDGKPALRRLRLLVKFIDEQVNGPLAKLKKAGRHQQVFFADLYHFFAPGDEVYKLHGSGTNEQVSAYRVLQVTGGRRFNFSAKSGDEDDAPELAMSKEIRGALGSPLAITCIHIDFNGEEFGPVTTRFPIREYTGERSTASLPVCPAAFKKDLENLKADLESRGSRFVELARVSHKAYSGLTIDPIEEIDSQVIVDFNTTFQAKPKWAPHLDIQYPPPADPRETAPVPSDNNHYYAKGTVLDSYENEEYYIHDDASIDQTRMKDFLDDHPIFRRDPPVLLRATQGGTELNNNYKRLLPGRVFGFVLRSRTWAQLNIRLVKDLPIKQDGFDQLVLPPGHKELVRALVKTHSRGSPPASGLEEEKEHQVDLVKGKGKGLIILLHGVPGVGKTSTAECIADYTQRPLYPITCGDIGETAEAVEAHLGKSFQLAHKWGCVLLLDEADVFMAKRQGSDIQRNSLVSAFKSRIHISLYYPPLDAPTTKQIWLVNIARLKSSERSYEIDEDAIIKFAGRHFYSEEGRWNGRQIRNAFQTVLALAEYDATMDMSQRRRVKVDHFQKVAAAASDFDRYLRDVYSGKDESARAFSDHLRKDDWGQRAIASVQPPMRGGNNNQGYHRQAQYGQQQQGFHGRDILQSEPSFDDGDPFQESWHPTLPNEVDKVRRPSPDPRNINSAVRSGYSDAGGPQSSNTPSPWGGSGGHRTVGRSQNIQDNRPRTSGTAHFEESGYKMEMTNNLAGFDDVDPWSMRGQGQESQGRVSAN
ncbi:MAG: hypothetical protein Q9192_005208, partial [Flavoplaca navasiana]